MAHALFDLLTEETRLRSMSTSHMIVPQNVLATYCSGNSSNGSSSYACIHCKKTNHRSEDCSIKYPEKLAACRSRRAARGHGPPLPSRASMVFVVISPASSATLPPSTSSGLLLSTTIIHTLVLLLVLFLPLPLQYH
jgi:hypothetical protein